jgi:hypothetical protein
MGDSRGCVSQLEWTCLGTWFSADTNPLRLWHIEELRARDIVLPLLAH